MFVPSVSIPQLGGKFNNEAQSYALSYGVSLNPRRLTQTQINAMKERRRIKTESIYASGNMSGAPRQVITAADQLGARVEGSFSYGSDGRVYWTDGTNISSNLSRVRSFLRGKPEYFNPSWSVLINWNKFVGAGSRLENFINRGWSDQDLMNRAAKSTYKNIVKKGILYASDPSAYDNRIANALRNRIDKITNSTSNKVAAIKSIADVFTSRGLKMTNSTVMNIEASDTNVSQSSLRNAGGRGVGPTGVRGSERTRQVIRFSQNYNPSDGGDSEQSS